MLKGLFPRAKEQRASRWQVLPNKTTTAHHSRKFQWQLRAFVWLRILPTSTLANSIFSHLSISIS